MRLDIQIDGDLNKITAAEYARGERAVTAAMRAAGQNLKANWRAQVAAALGTRMGNTARFDLFPKGQPSLRAAALVYTKSPEIIAAHERGALIRSQNGYWLAIPTKAAGKGKNGRRITPIEWEQKTGRALRFVYWGGRIAKLVDDGTAHHRRLNDSLDWSQRGAGQRMRRKSRPIFVLVPQVKLKKRLNLMAAGDAAQARALGLIIQNWRDNR